MAITVTHKFVSAIPDGDDATVVRPSNWNDTHDLTGTIPVENGGTGAATLTGYVKGNGTSAMTASATVPSTDITGLGTMATQNANAVAITGGTATLSSLTTPTVQATNSAGLSLKNSAGTTQMSMGAGGGDNLSINVSTNLDGANAQIDISPTGTGHVHIKPTGVNSIEIEPTFVGTMSNMNISLVRINPRIISITGAAGGTITPTGDTADQYEITALGAAATFAIPSGTPVDGQKLILRMKDDGTGRALTWTTSAGGYRALGFTLPTTTVASKVLYIGCVYNSQDSFWDVMTAVQQS